jgi:hypothetical protein
MVTLLNTALPGTSRVTANGLSQSEFWSMVTVAVTGPLKSSGASTVMPVKVKVAGPSEEPPAT